jgi:hypothetical protein
MPSIALVNTIECPCPWTHGAACREFLEGWDGFTVSEALTLTECAGKNWLLLSNHRIDWVFLDTLAAQNPNTIFILWSYHDHIHRIPFKFWVLTGEQYVNPPTLPGHAMAYAKMQSIPNYHPLLLRANEEPNRVGTYERSANPRYLGYFAGSGYNRNWINGLPDVFYHDVGTHGLLNCQQRREIALQSLFAFGFHSPENIANHHVTQRVFEGLAYGCIVLSNNPAAAKLTDGIVEYVGSREELVERIVTFIWNPDAVHEKRQAGYKWAKQYGTNRVAAEAFQKLASELWNCV